MFNRNKYNLGKFNTISGSVASSTATMLMEMSVIANANTKFSLIPNAMDSALEVSATVTRSFEATLQEMETISEVTANGVRAVFVSSLEADMQMEVQANSFNAFGFEVIKLNARGGLVLKPNDELRIDTEKMTVELNGVNVIKYFSSDSDFFYLKPSENIILYSNNKPTSKSEVKILWKDRWL